jgi:hypothetical protein
MTAPETAMACREFENHLTDYLDGFLARRAFSPLGTPRRFVRKCTDLPGEVVRSIAACYTYKTEELPFLPACTQKFCRRPLARTKRQRRSGILDFANIEWMRGLSFPIPIPQLAPVAMIMMFAAFYFQPRFPPTVHQRDVSKKF